MYTIRKEFAFCASHHLEGLAPGHPCSKNHGHNYIVIVELSSVQLNDVGFVIDYRELAPIKKVIDETFDHQNLNDFFTHANPTAEHIAKYLYVRIKPIYPQLSAIEVSETPKTNARYSPEYDG